MEDNIQTLKKQYEEKITAHDKLSKELKIQLEELLQSSKIALASPLENRTKSWDSIYKNIEEQKRYNPSSIDEIKDLSGLRIILLFKEDINKVCKIIETNFQILQKEDKESLLSVDQFGYGSIHYIITPKETWLSVPTLSSLKNLKAEIQVRTAAQHIWAAVSRLLSYNQKNQIPPPIERNLNRAAALLELVDLEFQRVLDSRDKYISQINQEKTDKPLDIETLRALAKELLPPENETGAENYSNVLNELKLFGINSSHKLRECYLKNKEKIAQEEATRVADPQVSSLTRVKGGVYYTFEGFLREMLRQEFPKEYKDYWKEKNKPSAISKQKK